MRCLVITPIPTLPANQGNAVNIARINQCIRASGCEVHMVYSTLEGITDWQTVGMRAELDELDIIPFNITLPDDSVRGNKLDDWFDPKVGEHVSWLCDQYNFEFVLIHYVWMSAVCAYLPPILPKILYTHDRFGERHQMLARAGIAPAWYSISVPDEARGLNRADLIIATQQEEASYFQTLTQKPVHVLGSIQALRERVTPVPVTNGKLRVGYLGSANPGNCRSMDQFIAAIDANHKLNSNNFELVLGGPISLLPNYDRDYIVHLGVVDRIEEMFQAVDIMINPSVGGSGLKIKTVECLAAGMPLVSTQDGMMGLMALHPAHACQDAADVALELGKLIDPSSLEELCHACRRTIELYTRDQIKNLKFILETVGISQRVAK